MSSILKALKKLEEEKARQKGVQVDLVQNILRGEHRSGETSSWRLPLLVLGLLLAGGLLGMLAVNWLGSSPPLPEPAPIVYASPPQGAEALPAPVASAPQPAASPPVIAPTVQEIAPSPAVAEPVTTEPPSARKAPFVAEEQTPAVDSAADTSPSAPAPAAEPEQLRVSGIVYQDDPEGRIAVVNDLPVMQGTPVAGAVVEEILPDRVRFSRDGHSFEVLLQE